MVRRVASSIFVGRVGERAALTAALEAAQHGEPGVVLLGGEAGIGKSRLAAELWTTARDRGARVASGHCLETKATALPFAPWVEILRAILVHDRALAVEVGRNPGMVELGRLVPELRVFAGADRSVPTADDRVQLFNAVLDFLRRLARDRPLAALIEDLHWADASTLDLLRFVAGNLAKEAILLVVTFRDDASEAGHELQASLSELARLPHVARIDLQPFDLREVTDQMTGIAGRPPPEDAATRIFARSDGNPFVVEELAGQPDGPLPATLRDVLATRLAALSPDTRRVVAVAAAIGRDVGQPLLTTVAAIPEQQLVRALREANEKHVLVHSPLNSSDFAFRHALIQEFAYGELFPAERAALHASIARALAGAGESPGEIARHALLAGEHPTALARSLEAADRAAESLAFAEALGHVHRALGLWDGVAGAEALVGCDRVAVLLLGARCAVAIGRWGEAVSLRRAALGELDVSRRDERVAILLDLADALQFSADWPGAAEAVREAATLVPPQPPSSQRARVLAELANWELDEGRIAAARRMADQAVEAARAAGAAAEEVRALVAKAHTYVIDLQFGVSAGVLDRARRVVAERGVTDEFVVATLIARGGEIALLVGDYQAALERVEAGLARAARAGTLSQQRPFLRWRTLTACAALGRWSEAEELVKEAEHDTTPMQYRWTIDIFLPVLIRQGRLAEAEQAVLKTDHGYDTPWEGAWTLQARIRLANALGRWADGRVAADEAIGLYPGEAESFLYEILPDSVCGEADWAEAARARRRTQDEADARRIGLDRLEVLRRILRGAIDRGGAGRLVEAILATAEAEGSRLDGSSDPARWLEAAGRAEELQQPWETAYARFRCAEAMLARRGDRSAAMVLLREARETATMLGAWPLLDQIDGLARRARLHFEAGRGARRTRQARNDDGVLVSVTSREWEVLSLVAAGHTNREIGEALFISEKTASVHVTNAMDKLGARSRYEAAACASRLGLLDPPERPERPRPGRRGQGA